MAQALKSQFQKQLIALSARKARIERKIQQELGRSMPCWLMLKQLKTLRLRLKDHMTSVRLGMSEQNFGKG